jgi:hypothetical protein
MHVVIQSVTELDFGWVFFYNSREFLQTADIMHDFPVGNAPFIEGDSGSLRPRQARWTL